MASKARVTESVVVHGPVEAVWTTISSGKFKFMEPHTVTIEVETKEGIKAVPKATAGATIKISMATGKSFVLRVTEFNEKDRVFAWHVVTSDTSSQPLSSDCRLQVFEVTESNSTFVQWSVLGAFASTKLSIAEALQMLKKQPHVVNAEPAVSPTSAAASASGASSAAAAAVSAAPASSQTASAGSTSGSDDAPPQASTSLLRNLSLQSQKALEVFSLLDANKDGRLTIKEFRVAMDRLCGLGPLPDMAVNIMLQEADQDCSNDVDYNEFVAYLKKKRFTNL